MALFNRKANRTWNLAENKVNKTGDVSFSYSIN